MRRKLTTHDWIVRQTEVPYEEPKKPDHPSSLAHIEEQLTVPYVEPQKRNDVDPNAIQYEEPRLTATLTTHDIAMRETTVPYRAPLPIQSMLFEDDEQERN